MSGNYICWMAHQYIGSPKLMLNGKVIPKAMGIYKPGSASGAANRMAAGTAMYEALAASMQNMSLSGNA